MAISKTQFCSELLTEFFNPAGPVFVKSLQSSDPKRPLVKAYINKGFRIEDTEAVEVVLENIIYQPGKNLFNQECFQFNCFEEEGIDFIASDESYASNISDICYVQYNNVTVPMEKLKRLKLGLECISRGSNARYFARGTKDINNYIYSADIGIINTISGTFTVLQKNVPFFSKREENKLYAKSTIRISGGVKAARIKRINSTSYEVIGFAYGQTENEFFFPHTTLKNNRRFVYEDQKISLENLCINLLLLTNFKQNINVDDQIVYRNINYSSPLIETSIINSAEALINLILREDVAQQGSIPEFISSYINNQSFYNSEADEEYNNRLSTCFEPNCFIGDCFEEVFNRSLINRSISNRACAWLVLFLVSYSINYNKDYSNNIKLVCDYILNQKDDNTLLFYKGWDQKDQECIELSTEDNEDIISEDESGICLEGEDPNDNSHRYLYSLNSNKEILTSTNIAIFTALLKTFEATQEVRYLVAADELYNSINKYLLTNDGLYKHSLSKAEPSIESSSYQLLLVNILQDFQHANSLINFFKSRLLAIPEPQPEQVLVGEEAVFVDFDPVVILDNSNLDSDSDKVLFTLTKNDTVSTLDDILLLNYLSFSNLKSISSNLAVTFNSLVEEKYEIIEEKVVEDRKETSLIFSIGCLIKNKSFIDFENQKFYSVLDFNNYRMQKELIYNKLVHSLPKDYGWFNPKLLAKQSNISTLLFSFSKALAMASTEAEFLIRTNSIDTSYGTLLNTKANVYGINRFNKEDDRVLKNRIKSKFLNKGITQENIKARMSLFNSEVIINDNYKAIQAYEDLLETLYTSNWGRGYLQGLDYNTNKCTFTFSQPVEPDVYEEIKTLKPAGIEIEVLENLTFFVGVDSNKGTAVVFTDIDGGCDNLDLETGKDILTEQGNRLCLEDEETLLTPIIVEPPIYPPLDEPIIEEDQNPCDCLSLAGFITLEGNIIEARNMRVIPSSQSIKGRESHDVNFTNDEENCVLENKNTLYNSSSSCLKIEEVETSYKNKLVNLGTLRKVEQVIVDNTTTYTLALLEVADGLSTQVIKEQESSASNYLLPNNNKHTIVDTINYLIIAEGSNITVLSKDNLNKINTTTTFNSQISNLQLVRLNNTTVGIYGVGESDNLYHYLWSEDVPNTFDTLGIVASEPNTSHRYFNKDKELYRYSGQSIFKHSIYSQPGTFLYDKSIDINNTSNLVESDFIYGAKVSSVSSTTNSIILYIHNQNLALSVLNDFVLSKLDYLDGFEVDVFNSGNLEFYKDYVVINGINKLYNTKTKKFSELSTFVCGTGINSSYLIQNSVNYQDKLLLICVDLTTGDWKRYLVEEVKTNDV